MKLLILALLLATSSSFAQERTAGGSLNTEASWSALQNQLNKTNSDVSVVKIDIAAIKACAAKGRVYSPGTNGADTNGCVPANSPTYDLVVTCGDTGQVYDKSANACVSPAPARWTFLQLGDPRLYLNGYPKNPPPGSPCSTSALNLATCTSVGTTCYTTRFANKVCHEGEHGACNAQYDGYAEIFKCI